MKQTHWTDPNGVEYKEIISRQHQRLLELADAYAKKGKQIWVHPFDPEQSKWVLLVKESNGTRT